MTTLFSDRVSSPIGTLLLITNGERLCALDYVGYELRTMALLHARYPNVQLQEQPASPHITACLAAYFAGDLCAIEHIVVETRGTSFQQHVWQALRTIPAGAVRSYSALAAQLTKPSAARAVGAANALNPIAIVTPCHRLVGTSGALTGYAGGLERKRWLLQHEGVDVDSLGDRAGAAKEKYRVVTANRLYTRA